MELDNEIGPQSQLPEGDHSPQKDVRSVNLATTIGYSFWRFTEDLNRYYSLRYKGKTFCAQGSEISVFDIDSWSGIVVNKYVEKTWFKKWCFIG